MTRFFATASLVLMTQVLMTGCGLQGAPPTRAMLKVIAVPETARVYVDERFVASAQVLEGRPRALRPGTHYVTVKAPGYFPHDLEVELSPGETVLRIRLEPIPR